MHFNEFGFDDELMDSLTAMHFENATPVQEQAIPVIMKGRDLIACAQTGTGKTAAYLLPVIDNIIRHPYEGIDTIVLVPTRELSIQIDQQMEGFGYYVDISSTAIYGGNDSREWDRQRTAIEEGADIIIATPGRMLQHIAMGYVDFSSVKHLILDEADRMLDMGFYDDIMKVVELLPKEGRQTLLFSATMPQKIRQLAKAILNNPEEISIAISKPAEGIRQLAYCVYDTQKIPLVKHLLSERKDGSTIIFSGRKQAVKDLFNALRRAGFNAGVIHSDLEQKDREEVLRQFKNRDINILVATDIIARGIDIEKIDAVINYDVPRDAEDYVHRIGRTARAQNKGEAFTLINENDMRSFAHIEQLIEKEVEKGDLPAELGSGPAYNPNLRRSNGGNNRGGRNGGNNGGNNGENGDKNRNRHRHRGGNRNRGKAKGETPNATGSAEKSSQRMHRRGDRHK